MKVFKVVSNSFCGERLEKSSSLLYEQRNDAKMCFDLYVKTQFIENQMLSSSNVKRNEDCAFECSDGGDWYYGVYLIEEEIIVNNSFNSSDIERLI